MELPSGKATLFTVIAFIVGGVVIPILSEMRQSFNQTKEISFKEADINSKHLTYILGNSDNVGQQLELAKFYSCVSTDDETRQGWLRYYQKKLMEFEDSQKEIKDTKDKIEKIIFKGDSLKELTEKDKYELNILNFKLIEKESSITKSYTSKGDVVDKNNLVSKKVYLQVPKKDNKFDRNLLLEKGWIIPPFEVRSDCPIENEIRYFNENDFSLAKELFELVDGEKNKFKIKRLNIKSPQGQLEIWLSKNSIN